MPVVKTVLSRRIHHSMNFLCRSISVAKAFLSWYKFLAWILLCICIALSWTIFCLSVALSWTILCLNIALSRAFFYWSIPLFDVLFYLLNSLSYALFLCPLPPPGTLLCWLLQTHLSRWYQRLHWWTLQACNLVLHALLRRLNALEVKIVPSMLTLLFIWRDFNFCHFVF